MGYCVNMYIFKSPTYYNNNISFLTFVLEHVCPESDYGSIDIDLNEWT
jgi:hypothetical protein